MLEKMDYGGKGIMYSPICDVVELKRPKDDYRLAPKKPTNPPMPKCKPPKDYWEIPSFMVKENHTKTVEAIPVDWILNNPKLPKNEDRLKVITDMIEDWRKDNQ